MSVDPSLYQSLKWRLIGPHRGGRVVAVAGHPTEKATFYFGACAGGVWKTEDAGQYWECISDGYFNTAAIGALAVSESDPNVIYAGTGETAIRGNVSHGDGVYKSTDGGRTWENVGLKDTRHIAKVRIHPQNPDIVYVAALGHAWGPNEERGVFRSTDGGKTWSKVLYKSDKAGAIDLWLDPKNPRTLYAAIWEAQRYPHKLVSGGPDSGIWKSTDGGDTWEDISRNPGLPQEGVYGKIGICASPAKPDRVWALIEHDEGGMYRSDDGGKTWSNISTMGELRRRAWYYMHVIPDPSDADTVWVMNLQCWKSIDGGKTYEAIPTPHGDNHDLWIDPEDSNRMVQGNDGGANVSLNGGRSWSTIFNQPTAQFYHVTTDNRHPYWVYGSQQDNTALGLASRSANGAITTQEWIQPGGGESGYIAIDPRDPNIVYGGAIGSGLGHGRLVRYDGSTFEERLVTAWPEVMGMGRGAESVKYRFQWTFPIEFSPHNPEVLYACSQYVHRSTDEGHSWEVISPDLTRNDPEKLKPSGGPITRDNTGAEYYCTIFAFHESPHEEGVFWAGSDDGLIHISKDGGANWQNITPPAELLPEWALISIIELSPHDPATAYVAATRYKHDDNTPYLLKTNDYGETWQLITNGILEDDFTRVIREDPNRRGLLYAGTETGLYISFDDGANWQRFQLNLPVCPIYDITIKNRDLIAATHGRSFWILDDLTPLYQIDEEVQNADMWLFKPAKVRRFRELGRYGQNVGEGKKIYGRISGMLLTSYHRENEQGEIEVEPLDAGKNPPNGAIIHYYFKEAPEGEVKLTILDEDDNVVREFSSENKNGVRVPKAAGANRFVWDLRYPDATPVEDGVEPNRRLADALKGPVAAPGKYKVRLEANGQTMERKLKIKRDKRVKASKKELREQFDLLIALRDKLSELNSTVNDLRKVRAQVLAWMERTDDEDIKSQGQALKEQLDRLEEELYSVHAADPRALPGGLSDTLGALPPQIANADRPPTVQQVEASEKVMSDVDAKLEEFRQLLSEEVRQFNRTVAEKGLEPVQP